MASHTRYSFSHGLTLVVEAVGESVGDLVGESEGKVGALVGEAVGESVGDLVGESKGASVGEAVARDGNAPEATGTGQRQELHESRGSAWHRTQGL